jgi:hypothetical protein
MAKTATERKRGQRQRDREKKAGIETFAIRLHAGAIADALVEEGDLAAWDSEDREAVEAGLLRHLIRLMRRHGSEDD